MGIADHFSCLLRNLYAGQKLEPDMEKQAGSKLGKEYVKYVNYVKVYIVTLVFSLMHSISFKILDWMKHKLETILPGEILIISDMQMTPPLWQKVKRN